MHDQPHPTDAVSLIAGIAFVAVAVAVLTDLLVAVDVRVMSWLLPAAVVLVGLGLLGSALRGREPAEDHRDRDA